MAYDIDEVREEIEAGTAQLLDVREQNEWDMGHLSDAKLVPLSQLQHGIEPTDFDQSKKTYLHCRSGQRVYAAAPILKAMGFEDVTPLDEGFEELVANGVFEEA